MEFYAIFKFISDKTMAYFANVANVLQLLGSIVKTFNRINKDSKPLKAIGFILCGVILIAIYVYGNFTYHESFAKIPNPLGINYKTAVQEIIDAGFNPPSVVFIVSDDAHAIKDYVTMVKIDGKLYNKESIYQKEQRITLYAILNEQNSYEASDAGYSKWSEWTVHSYNPDNKPQFGHYTLIEIEDLGMQNTTDYYIYTLGDPITKTKLINVGTIPGTTMKGYKVYYMDGQYYAIKDGIDWENVEEVSLVGSAKDTLSVRYTYLGQDEERTDMTIDIEGLQKSALWKREERDVGIVNYDDNTITYPSGETVQGVAIEGNIYIVDGVEIFVAYETICTPIMKDTYYYRQRTREKLK